MVVGILSTGPGRARGRAANFKLWCAILGLNLLSQQTDDVVIYQQ